MALLITKKIKIRLTAIILALISSFCYGIDVYDAELEANNVRDLPQEVVFISLGSYCLPAHAMRNCGVRKVAFPFDWIISFNGEALIEILNTDFQGFLDESYLVPNAINRHMLNTHYQLEYTHEGAFSPEGIQKLRLKFERRIDRFRQLADFKGKVVFIRSGCIWSIDPSFSFSYPENLEISDDYALRLYSALRNKFPKLDFDLFIFNFHDEFDLKVERKLNDHLIIARTNPKHDLDQHKVVYGKFFAEPL